MTELTDPDKPHDQLHLAAKTGKLESAQSILSHGADPNLRRDEQGETPLMEASRWGHVEILRLLMNSGADVNLKTQDAWTALHAACVGKHGEIIDLLLLNGADPNVCSYHRRFDEDLGWNFAGTPLHVAAAYGSTNVSEQLLAKGALINESIHFDRRTPIFYAAAYGHAEMIAFLCKHGANPNCREHRHEYDLFFDHTPLHYAARNGHVEATKVLLSYRAEPRAIESYSRHTALQMARASKHTIVMKLLREYKK